MGGGGSSYGENDNKKKNPKKTPEKYETILIPLWLYIYRMMEDMRIDSPKKKMKKS